MNLLDQLELYILELGGNQVEYWSYVSRTMRSGLLLTKQLEKHLEYKLEHLESNKSIRHEVRD